MGGYLHFGTMAGNYYVLEAATDSGFTSPISSVTTNVNATNLAFNADDLTPNTTYWVRVGALYYGATTYAATTPISTATLTDLITGTEVLYRVSTSGVELASGSFRTAAGPDQPFSFAAIGDSGTGSTAQYAVADRMVVLDPNFVLHTGDVVYPDGQADGYDPFFFQPYQTLARRAPIFPTLGNHDYHSQRGQPYLDAFYLPHNNPANTERYYSFDWGDAHFTALDFNTGPDADQLAWLKDDLAATDKRWKFVFYHQAIYSSGPHGYESWVEAKRQLLAPIFEQHHVDIVFNGHDHDYERFVPLNAARGLPSAICFFSSCFSGISSC